MDWVDEVRIREVELEGAWSAVFEEEGGEGGGIVDVWEVLMGMELVLLVVELEELLWGISWWGDWGWEAGV